MTFYTKDANLLLASFVKGKNSLFRVFCVRRKYSVPITLYQGSKFISSILYQGNEEPYLCYCVGRESALLLSLCTGNKLYFWQFVSRKQVYSWHFLLREREASLMVFYRKGKCCVSVTVITKIYSNHFVSREGT